MADPPRRVVKVGVEAPAATDWPATCPGRCRLEVVEVNRPNRQLRRAKGSPTPSTPSRRPAVLAGMPPRSRRPMTDRGSDPVVQVAHTSTRQALQKVDGRIRSLTITAPETLRVEFTG